MHVYFVEVVVEKASLSRYVRLQVPESIAVGTRKMVNYAWLGRSQRKLLVEVRRLSHACVYC